MGKRTICLFACPAIQLRSAFVPEGYSAVHVVGRDAVMRLIEQARAFSKKFGRPEEAEKSKSNETDTQDPRNSMRHKIWRDNVGNQGERD